MSGKRTFEILGPDGPRPFPTREEINRYLVAARRHRAEASAAMLASAFRGMAGPLRALGARFARWRRQQRPAYHRSLMRSSGRLLADVASRARTSR